MKPSYHNTSSQNPSLVGTAVTICIIQKHTILPWDTQIIVTNNAYRPRKLSPVTHKWLACCCVRYILYNMPTKTDQQYESHKMSPHNVYTRVFDIHGETDNSINSKRDTCHGQAEEWVCSALIMSRVAAFKTSNTTTLKGHYPQTTHVKR
jgi:hypothetical protein